MITMNALPDPPLAHRNEGVSNAQARWAAIPVRERLKVIRALRHLIAEHADALAESAAAVSGRPLAEKLVSEVLPLAEACRWLEKCAARILATRREGNRNRPLWMHGVSFEVQRQPFGLVLIIGPGNYPLLLPAVQTLQALAAGNAVLLKPAPGTRNVALAFARLVFNAGLDRALLTILPESVAAAHIAIDAGVDKVVFTGSSDNGRDVLSALARTNTPSIMELSGRDAVLVFADADLELVVRALNFGMRLNGGETCMVPQRLIVMDRVADALLSRLSSGLVSKIDIERVRDEAEAVQRINETDFALGACIFSRDVSKARRMAALIKTGFVLINDLIVPTADPRMPFGGIKASGFGSTRGPEGLLEMTFPHVVGLRSGPMHPHFDEAEEGDEKLFSAYIKTSHGKGGDRLSALKKLVGGLMAKAKKQRNKK